MMHTRKRRRLIDRKTLVGYVFVLPFIIGYIFLFLKPMITSVIYSFSNVSFDETGLVLKSVGWENYQYALFRDPNFVRDLLSICGDIVVKVLVIMFMSMFVAMLLNQKFAGRLLFRTIMFLPVIFGADVVLALFSETAGYSQMSSTSNQFVEMGTEAQSFINQLVSNFGFLTGLMNVFITYAQKLFDLTWEMGIQVVLFIIGFQAIPGHLYEVCDIEGATKWETFWKVTFPLLTPSMLLCLIYTIIRCFNSDNAIVLMIAENITSRIHYACALTWLYSIVVFVVVGIVYWIVSKRTVYLD